MKSLASFLAGALLCANVFAATTVKIDTEKTSEPISKYIYGQFVEHLGKSIYGGLWAEMLSDRKFFYDVTDKFEPWGTGNDTNWKSGPFQFLKASPWKVIGPGGTVTMETDHAFVGAHSPVIHVKGDGSEAGISQEGLAVEQGKKYEGYIYLRGDSAAAPIVVRLASEGGPPMIVSIDKITGDYAKYPLEFSPAASSDNVTIDVVSKGNGSFSVGTISLMPNDNIDGWRADTIACLKELDAPIYRWPGGNFVSGYNWRDGIGPRDTRPPRKNPAWTSIEANDVGIHEFMNLMKIIDSEPYVALNTGLGTPEQAAQEVEYLNGDAGTEMGKWRSQNGHPDKFGVKIFAVGNEMFGNWQLGHIPLSDYTAKNNTTADALWKVDPSIQLVAVGALGKWDQGMLADCADHMTFLSEHIYVKELPDPAEHARQLAVQIKKVADAHRQYRQDISQLKGKNIRLAMDEWNFWYGPYAYGELGTQYRLKDALGVALGLHEFFRNSDLFFMANYAQTVNVLGAIKTSRTAAEVESTGKVLKLYRRQFGTIPVAVGEQPKDMDISAAWTDDKSALTVGIVNLSMTAQSIQLDTGAVAFKPAAKKWEINGPDPESHNTPGLPLVVTIHDSDAQIADNTLTAVPFSVTLYRLEKQ